MWFLDPLNLWMPLVAVISVLYWYIKHQSSFWSKKGVPFIEPHWLFGNFRDFVKGKSSLTEITVDIYKKFKGEKFGGVWQMQSPTLFVMDPDLLRDIMVKDFPVWSSRGITVNLDVDPLAAHLINLDGSKWKSVRSKLTPTFTSGKLKQMHHLLLECAKEFANYLDSVVANGEPVEMKDMAAKFTTDVIGSCVFGIQMNAISDEDALFRSMGKKIFQLTFRKKMIRLLQTSFPRLFTLLKLPSIDKELTEFFLRIVRESFEYREKNNIQRHDFIDLLRELKNTGVSSPGEEEMVFDDALLAAQAFVFFGAGFETSAGTISYCLHELAVNEEVQERLREEIQMTKASNEGEITWDALKNMKYLDMVVQETWRKHPPITISTRKSVKPYQIRGTNVRLPCGTSCLIPIYALHHDEKFFPNPEKFDPERFTDEAKSQRLTPCFIPFGSGPRNCIAGRFAKQQVKLGLFKTVENFKISLCEKSQNPLQHNPAARFLSPKDGIWLRLSKNSSN